MWKRYRKNLISSGFCELELFLVYIYILCLKSKKNNLVYNKIDIKYFIIIGCFKLEMVVINCFI